MVIYISGHKNPDTDAIVSAIAYSIFKNKTNQDEKYIPLKLEGKLNGETKFVLDKFNFEVPKEKKQLEENSKIILVDHNEKRQSFDNLEELDIQEVIEHHKFSFKSKKPLTIIAKPIGSTSTLIGELFLEEDIDLTKDEAGILISGIISDTLYLRSPTTTHEDKTILKKLNDIAELDLEEFSKELFKAKSDVSDMSNEEILTIDFKQFKVKEKKVGIGVFETTYPKSILDKKEELIEVMKKKKEELNLEHFMFCVIDIIEEKNKTFYCEQKDKQIFKELFEGEEIEENVLDLKRRISRKKQLIPVFEEKLN